MIDKPKVFSNQFPNAIYFDEHHLDDLPEYLQKKGIISKSEKVLSTEKPGEGNMNFVRRVITNEHSFIIKQCRPWVEKYPDISAPVERLKAEATYYQLISTDPFFSEYSPKMFLYDPKNMIIAFEDLGKGSDFTFSYKKSDNINANELDSLLEYISHLHHMEWNGKKNKFPSNKELKQLNHEHIFEYPYMMDNGFDLDTVQPGLQKHSIPIKQDTSLKKKIQHLGNNYLDSGPVLIHGDYYPGSWLNVDQNVKVIDPEFAFFGFAEFDIAVMTAHLLMTGMNIAAVQKALIGYRARSDFSNELFCGFCGVEILRRIIGLAQLPLDLSLNEKVELLELAQEFINSPTGHNLIEL